MRLTGAITVLVIPALAFGGGLVALTSSSAEFERHRAAQATFETALADAHAARAFALVELGIYRDLSAQSRSVLQTATDLLAVGSDRLDSSATGNLTQVVERLRSVLPDNSPSVQAVPSPIASRETIALTNQAAELSRWAGALRDEWASRGVLYSEVGDALRAVRTGIMAIAGSVAETGKLVYDGSSSASTETRAALAAVLARLAVHVEEGTDPSADLKSYLEAAQAARDSHTAALAATAAAEAASGSGSGSGGAGGRRGLGGFPMGSYEEAYYICHGGLTFPAPEGVTPAPFPCTVQSGDGTIYTFYN